jgi:hypothetical protein
METQRQLGAALQESKDEAARLFAACKDKDASLSVLDAIIARLGYSAAPPPSPPPAPCRPSRQGRKPPGRRNRSSW